MAVGEPEGNLVLVYADAMSSPNPIAAPPRRRVDRTRWTVRLRNGLIGSLGPWVVKLGLKTLRVRLSGPGLISRSPRGRRPVIFAFWHERLLISLHTHGGTGARTLVSTHADGQMVAAAAERLGCVVFRGSTTRHGFRAMREMLQDVANGYDYGLTPDGPRGPRRQFQVGTVYFASRSGLPIVPCTVSYGRFHATHAWDRFVLPWPFTRALVYFGRPIQVPPDLDFDQLQQWADRLGAVLSELTDENDRLWRQRYAPAMPYHRFRKT